MLFHLCLFSVTQVAVVFSSAFYSSSISLQHQVYDCHFIIRVLYSKLGIMSFRKNPVTLKFGVKHYPSDPTYVKEEITKWVTLLYLFHLKLIYEYMWFCFYFFEFSRLQFFPSDDWVTPWNSEWRLNKSSDLCGYKGLYIGIVRPLLAECTAQALLY